ncbi:MAG: rRNA maturation RNase YbeY, partial [Nitrospirota bacterium]|nr:rRNA maturation RNase YbeY [Nitrospirota bacterium]
MRKALHLLGLHTAEISILFVNEKRMKMLNQQFRGMDKTTDVLSFPQIPKFEIRNSKFLKSEIHIPHSALLLGDIVINLQQAKRQAVEHNLT